MYDQFFSNTMVLWKGGNPDQLIVRRQARDELFKTSGDESKEDKGGKEQALYKTDMIKIRKAGSIQTGDPCVIISIYIADILCIYIYIYVNYLTQCLGGIYCKSWDLNFKKGPSPSPPLKCTIVMCENELFSLTPSHPESSEKNCRCEMEHFGLHIGGICWCAKNQTPARWAGNDASLIWSSSRVSLRPPMLTTVASTAPFRNWICAIDIHRHA